MKTIRPILAVSVVMLALVPGIGRADTTTISAPFDHGETYGNCNDYDRLATCSGTESSDSKTGELSIDRHVTSSVGETLPTAGNGYAEAVVHESFDLPVATHKLTLTLHLHVITATAAISGVLHGNTASENWRFDEASASAWIQTDNFGTCDPGCGEDGYEATIADASGGPSSTQDADVTAQYSLGTGDNGSILPGTIDFTAGVNAGAFVQGDNGRADVSVDAVVTGIDIEY